MSFITRNAPPTRPPISRSGTSTLRTQRNSPDALRSRRSHASVAPANARSMCVARSASVSAGMNSASAWPSRSSLGTPIQSLYGRLAKRSFCCRSK